MTREDGAKCLQGRKELKSSEGVSRGGGGSKKEIKKQQEKERARERRKEGRKESKKDRREVKNKRTKEVKHEIQ